MDSSEVPRGGNVIRNPTIVVEKLDLGSWGPTKGSGQGGSGVWIKAPDCHTSEYHQRPVLDADAADSVPTADLPAAVPDPDVASIFSVRVEPRFRIPLCSSRVSRFQYDNQCVPGMLKSLGLGCWPDLALASRLVEGLALVCRTGWSWSMRSGSRSAFAC